jgi:hypothetical protein
MNFITSWIRELVVIIEVGFLVDAPRPLGSMPKDSLKIVANWLVKLFVSAHGSALARASIMSIGCGLNGNCGCLVIKAVVLRLALRVVSRRVVVGGVRQESRQTIG